MVTKNFLFNVTQKYLPGHLITQPIWIGITYEYDPVVKSAGVSQVSVPFNLAGAILFSSNLKKEIEDAAENNAKSTFGGVRRFTVDRVFDKERDDERKKIS